MSKIVSQVRILAAMIIDAFGEILRDLQSLTERTANALDPGEFDWSDYEAASKLIDKVRSESDG